MHPHDIMSCISKEAGNCSKTLMFFSVSTDSSSVLNPGFNGPLQGNGQVQIFVFLMTLCLAMVEFKFLLRCWPSARQWSSPDFCFSNDPLLGNGRILVSSAILTLCKAMVKSRLLFCGIGPLQGNGQVQIFVFSNDPLQSNGQIQVVVLRYWPSARRWSSPDFCFF
ncbi:hypothetical protein LR48_Vigan2367s000100 [Vigna angularis]|nr:hypothetical protein LR48_Vigan2367s000100 [Vigna angularis]